MRDVRERLQDIIEAIAHIQRYTSSGRETFEKDELIQSWCVRHLQIIGEAARALPEEARIGIPEIPWSKVIGMRHILVHNYFGIDIELVWNVVENDLPVLKNTIEVFLNKPEE